MSNMLQDLQQQIRPHLKRRRTCILLARCMVQRRSRCRSRMSAAVLVACTQANRQATTRLHSLAGTARTAQTSAPCMLTWDTTRARRVRRDAGADSAGFADGPEASVLSCSCVAG